MFTIIFLSITLFWLGSILVTIGFILGTGAVWAHKEYSISEFLNEFFATIFTPQLTFIRVVFWITVLPGLLVIIFPYFIKNLIKR